MWKHKTQSFTAIFGLAFGIACFVPALYWMRHETSYDSFYPGAAQIYRIYAVDKQSGKVNEQVPGILEKKMHEHFPGTETSTVFFQESNGCKTADGKHLSLRTVNTDSTFFRVFRQEFVSGDGRRPLEVVNNIVLTESAAARLFGDAEKAIGQPLQSTFYFFNPPYAVTAVVKDPPANTNVPFDAILFHDLLPGLAALPEDMQWLQFNVQMYVKLHPGANAGRLAEELRDFPSRIQASDNIEVGMKPLGDVRHSLHAGVPFTLIFIRLFVAAGILLLFSAAFNFLNLRHELFRRRLGELRQRTVHGATGGQLTGQLAVELTGAILLALALGCCLVVIARGAFSGLLDMAIGLPELVRLYVVCATGATALLLLTGLVPIRLLSRQATRNLSVRKITVTGQPPVLRRMAVALQLAVSVALLVVVCVVMMQMLFINRKGSGFDRSGIIQLNGLPPYMQANLRTALIHELEAIPQVESITATHFEPLHNANTAEMISVVKWTGKPSYEAPSFNVIPADSRFAELFHLKMLTGEWWKEDGGEHKIVLNKKAVRVMELTDPVGTTIRMSIDDVDLDEAIEEYQIVGVVGDFHTLSLRSRIHPTIFRPSLSGSRIATDNVLYIHVAPGREKEAIQRIAAIIPDIDPSFTDLRLSTLDDLYNRLNYSEQAGLKLFSVLTTVCLLISLSGIYAVAASSTRSRRKEIAIRKIVGAEAGKIVGMFFREYALLTVIAGCIALPPAYIAMNNWLQGYAYHTNIPWWLPAGVITGVVALVLLTVLGQTLKAAGSNPAEVVKSE
jgi:putative ABC transport system permease protein